MFLTKLFQHLFIRQSCRSCGSFLASRKRTYVFTSAGDSGVYRLKSRGLVRVKGRDTVQFLQGLVTSDVESLGSVMGAQYAMLLNVQGRVLYDLVLYDVSTSVGESAILIECDRSVTDQFISDIKKYKIRKKVVLENMNEVHNVYAVMSNDLDAFSKPSSIIVQTSDPRVPQFGQRLITESSGSSAIDDPDESGYHERRMEWGIPEGLQDLPPGSCFPLENNLVYMNGVSFSKGCYLGQELTARTHHTGVTRKRIMPLVFHNAPGEIENNENIKSADNKNVGKFRSCQGNFGLGMMRMANLTETLTVVNKAQETIKLQAVIPKWWPENL